jgi:hypothetical protein
LRRVVESKVFVLDNLLKATTAKLKKMWVRISSLGSKMPGLTPFLFTIKKTFAVKTFLYIIGFLDNKKISLSLLFLTNITTSYSKKNYFNQNGYL